MQSQSHSQQVLYKYQQQILKFTWKVKKSKIATTRWKNKDGGWTLTNLGTYYKSIVSYGQTNKWVEQWNRIRSPEIDLL